jgi:hypothetical protein
MVLAAKLNPSTWNRRTERTVPVSFVQTLAMARVGEVESGMLGIWWSGREEDGGKKGDLCSSACMVALKTRTATPRVQEGSIHGRWKLRTPVMIDQSM